MFWYCHKASLGNFPTNVFSIAVSANEIRETQLHKTVSKMYSWKKKSKGIKIKWKRERVGEWVGERK